MAYFGANVECERMAPNGDCREDAQKFVAKNERIIYRSGHSLTVCDGHLHTLIQVHTKPIRQPNGFCADWCGAH